jgi:chemotaxis signal transduction protein
MANQPERLPDVPTVAGIRCRVGKAEIALPLDGVGQIIEYPVVALPLARRFVGGVGLHQGRPLLSIALGRLPDRPRGQQRTTRGILLEAGRGDQMEWALEIEQMGTFVRAILMPQAPKNPELPPWISQARDPEGKLLGWIDVPAMLADLSGAEEK